MRQFFYPSSLAIFGVADRPKNLAKNVLLNCRGLGYKGKFYPVGRTPGMVFGHEIITDPETLPEGIDLAVILVPARLVAETMELCGRKGIRHAIVSSGGFSELAEENNQAEKDLVRVAEKYGIRFIGPNCLGIVCANSGLCTPFNLLRSEGMKQGRVSLIVQSGGVTTQSGYYFSEEHVGFSKIISAGNKLDLDEIELIKYLMDDEDTDQIHLYLESIDDGRELVRLAKESTKPIVIFKSNVSRTASQIAMSHTAALSNNDRIVEGALRQAGIIRVRNIHDMTVCAKILQLPPLKGDRLVTISLSGGFSIIMGDACEEHGFYCPALPPQVLQEIESHRRGGVINMSNPMDFGDVHDLKTLFYTIETSLALDYIDGLVLSFLFGPDVAVMFGEGFKDIKDLLVLLKDICAKYNKPIALSLFSDKRQVDELKSTGIFPVFNDPVESIRGLRMLRDYWRNRDAAGVSDSRKLERAASAL